MVLISENTQYSIKTSLTDVGLANPSNVNTPNNLIFSGSEPEAPVVLLKAEEGLEVEAKTKRSVAQLYDSIASICTKYGLNINEAKNTGLLCSIAKMSEEELLNADQSVINNTVQKLENAIKAIHEDIDDIKNGSKNLTFDLIIGYARLLNGEVPRGWDSVDSFRKAQKRKNQNGNSSAESLSERLKTMYNFDIKGKSPNQIAAKLEAYFDSYFQSLKGSKKEVDNKQLTDFTKLLFNSSREENELFMNSLKYLVNNNKVDGLKGILERLSEEESIELIKNTPENFVEETMTTPDQRGEIASVQQTASFVSVFTDPMDKETFEEYHKNSNTRAQEFYTEENLAILEEIKNNPEIKANIQEKLVIIERVEYIKRKLENKEDISNEERVFLEANANVALTDEEKKYLDVYAKSDFYPGDNAGQIIGLGTNNIIEQDAKKELLTTINYDAYKIGEKAGNDFYRDVLKEVVNYKNTLSEEDKIAFENLMKDTIGENYTKVDNDIAKGTKTELTIPSVPVENKNENPTNSVTTTATNKGALGYDLNDTPAVSVVINDNRISDFYAINCIENKEIENNDKQIKNDNIITVSKGHISTFFEYVKNNGIFKTVGEIYNNIGHITNQGVITFAQKLYQLLPDNRQIEILKKVKSTNGLKELLGVTADNVILKIDYNFTNEYHNKMLEDAKEKAEKRISDTTKALYN